MTVHGNIFITLKVSRFSSFRAGSVTYSGFLVSYRKDSFTQAFLMLLFRDIIISHQLEWAFINYRGQNERFGLLTPSSTLLPCSTPKEAAALTCFESDFHGVCALKTLPKSLMCISMCCHSFLFALVRPQINLCLIKKRPVFSPLLSLLLT